MKILAWYSLIVIVISEIACLINVVNSNDASTNMVAIILWAPVLVYFVKRLNISALLKEEDKEVK